jgi:predicted metal-dependent hydrolase
MIKKIIYKNQEISYLIKNTKKLNNLKITISKNKKYVLVNKPFFVSEKSIKKIITEKAEWILENLERMKNRKTRLLEKGGQKDFLINKSKIRKIIKEKLDYYNQFYNFKFNKVFIRNQKTRWGSCSSQGNLNFNYRLIYLEEKFIDYIIVHELCHLGEMNHGKNFWDLVEKKIPDYKIIRKKLKKI